MKYEAWCPLYPLSSSCRQCADGYTSTAFGAWLWGDASCPFWGKGRGRRAARLWVGCSHACGQLGGQQDRVWGGHGQPDGDSNASQQILLTTNCIHKLVTSVPHSSGQPLMMKSTFAGSAVSHRHCASHPSLSSVCSVMPLLPRARATHDSFTHFVDKRL